MEAKRRSEFKKGLNLDDGRRNREANQFEIRKNKKEENMSKRRNMPTQDVVTSPFDAVVAPAVPQTVDDYSQLMQGLVNPDPQVQYESIKSFRKLLSVEKNPPVQKCIDCGAVPMFVKYLQRYDATNLQFEAAWALTNIASTDRTSLVVECGAIPHLVASLSSQNADLREQCAWCLGNVAGDSASLRDVVLDSNAMAPLLANIQQPANISLLRNCVWSLSNFCRGKPQPSICAVQPALPVLAAVLASHDDLDTLSDALWALSYISDGNDERIQTLLDCNGPAPLIPVLVKMLTSDKVQLIVPALRALGNVASGNDSQTQAVVNANVLPALGTLLQHSKKNIRKETCWMLSNIAAGNRAQLVKLMNTPNLVQEVLGQLSCSNDWEVRKEATWVLSNIVTSGGGIDNLHYISEVVRMGAIGAVCNLLDVADAKLVIVALEALESIMKGGVALQSSEEYINLVEEADGVEKLENLQEHENEEIYQKSVSIIENYFGAEEVIEEAAQQITTLNNQNVFSFGGGFGAENTIPQNYDFGMPAASGKIGDFNNNHFFGQEQQQNIFNNAQM